MNQDNLYQKVYIEETCPECGNKVEQIDKDTSTERDMRLYACSVCEWSDYIDVGIPLWKAYSEFKKLNNK